MDIQQISGGLLGGPLGGKLPCPAIPSAADRAQRGQAHQALKEISSGVHLAYRFSPSALDATQLVEGVMCLSGADTCEHRI